MKKIRLGAILMALLLTVASCNNNDDDEKLAKLSIRLTDAPAAYEEVLIDIQGVKINVNDEDEGWITLDDVETGIYNLLDFTNGVDTLLAEQELPAGKVSQMRLILGDNNKVKVDGQYHDLKTPSAQQSGLKLNIHADLVAGLTYRLWIDFDAGRSVVKKGNGTYSLKPVIRTFTEATSGAIQGIVNPKESKPYVMAITAVNDTFATFADTASGEFLIRALPEGTYKLDIRPVEGYQKKEIEDIDVVEGVVKDLGEIMISELTE